MPSAGAAGQSSAVSQNTLHSPEEDGWHAGRGKEREGEGKKGEEEEEGGGGGRRERGRERDENSQQSLFHSHN